MSLERILNSISLPSKEKEFETFLKYLGIQYYKEFENKLSKIVKKQISNIPQFNPLYKLLSKKTFISYLQQIFTKRKIPRSVISFYLFDEKMTPEVKEILVGLDIIIASADDLYDEELPDKEKMLLIGSILLVTSNYLDLDLPQDISRTISKYILIPAPVSLAEQKLKKRITKKKTIRKKDIMHFYLGRGLDMDPFIAIPIEVLETSYTTESYIKLGRRLRALMLMWKDIVDYPTERDRSVLNYFPMQEFLDVAYNLYEDNCKYYKEFSSDFTMKICRLSQYFLDRIYDILNK